MSRAEISSRLVDARACWSFSRQTRIYHAACSNCSRLRRQSPRWKETPLQQTRSTAAHESRYDHRCNLCPDSCPPENLNQTWKDSLSQLFTYDTPVDLALQILSAIPSRASSSLGAADHSLRNATGICLHVSMPRTSSGPWF